jgi:hypothetical protein
MNIPATDLAKLDQARARVDEALTENVAIFRRVVAESSVDEAAMQATVTFADYPASALAGMLAIAITRLARQEMH